MVRQCEGRRRGFNTPRSDAKKGGRKRGGKHVGWGWDSTHYQGCCAHGYSRVGVRVVGGEISTVMDQGRILIRTKLSYTWG